MQSDFCGRSPEEAVLPAGAVLPTGAVLPPGNTAAGQAWVPLGVFIPGTGSSEPLAGVETALSSVRDIPNTRSLAVRRKCVEET